MVRCIMLWNSFQREVMETSLLGAYKTSWAIYQKLYCREQSCNGREMALDDRLRGPFHL